MYLYFEAITAYCTDADAFSDGSFASLILGTPSNAVAPTANSVSLAIDLAYTFVCNNGYTGSPTSTCAAFDSTDGKWGTVSGSCTGLLLYVFLIFIYILLIFYILRYLHPFSALPCLPHLFLSAKLPFPFPAANATRSNRFLKCLAKIVFRKRTQSCRKS